MDKLIIAAALFALGLWIWSEYFRAIPNLEQAGVLKNFQVESIEPHQAEYRVLAKQYYGPERRTIHPASPVVGSFNDLAYVSNIDLLLAAPNVASDLFKPFKLEQDRRCLNMTATDAQANPANIQPHLLNLSVIAASEAVANKVRRLKADQRIWLQGDWVQVKSATSQQEFQVGKSNPKSAQCRLFRITDLKVLD